VSESAFRGSTAAWVAAACAVSFVFAILTWVFGGSLTPVRSRGSDAYSRSALGHQAFLETLRALDVPVLVSRWRSAEKAGDQGLLVIAEPQRISWTRDVPEVDPEGRDWRHDPGDDPTSSLGRMIRDAGATLIVLPKWEGQVDWDREDWVSAATPVPEERVNGVLDALGIAERVERLPRGARRTWSAPSLGVLPTLEAPQVLQPGDEGPAIEPIVTTGDSVLFGRIVRNQRPLYLLTDPDVISTQGLGLGDNAVLAYRIVERARGGRSTVVFDETLHGHVREESLWMELFRFPLVLALGHVMLAVAVLLWAGMGRFGRPLPPPAAIEPGKRFLVDNTADLIRVGGHSAHALERYLASAVQEVAQRTHAPASVRGAELSGWLARAGKARGAGESLTDLEVEVRELRAGVLPEPRRLVAAAGRIHRWKREMTDGRAVDS
jgi:hypothetical protein